MKLRTLTATALTAGVLTTGGLTTGVGAVAAYAGATPTPAPAPTGQPATPVVRTPVVRTPAVRAVAVSVRSFIEVPLESGMSCHRNCRRPVIDLRARRVSACTGCWRRAAGLTSAGA